MKPIATILVLLSLSAVAASQNWRVLQQRETVTLDKGPPVSLPAGFKVCGDGRVPAVLSPRGTFIAGGCVVVFSGGFEHE